ncbi:hypothetical protein Ga0609869_002960 [Rhodovulum iodosum]|uniref:DUF4398 domain-containing protein n=1 Tax=Rhodovulum iodosum TaxID=68291 RepID=A0ABV3XW71_9RHOB|nr:hypothetical protein [Rhodovulum robiginosum]RSK36740.1 hypothetical protein EJA01_04385 [Rhodovulum robiginosum]
MPRAVLLLICLALAAGCAPRQTVGLAEAGRTAALPYPVLLPLDGLLAGTEDTRLEDDSAARLAARAAALRAKAARLNAPVLAPAARRDLEEAAERRAP